MECPFCSSSMFTVVKTGNTFTAHDDAGDSVPIPDEALSALERDLIQLHETQSCPVGFPLSYRVGIVASRVVARVGRDHIEGRDHHQSPSDVLPGEREARSPQRVSVDPFNPDVNKRSRLV